MQTGIINTRETTSSPKGIFAGPTKADSRAVHGTLFVLLMAFLLPIFG
ncbi:MAG: hypothetical protein V3T49_03745 [Dehalococcoidia bacterium]